MNLSLIGLIYDPNLRCAYCIYVLIRTDIVCIFSQDINTGTKGKASRKNLVTFFFVKLKNEKMSHFKNNLY